MGFGLDEALGLRGVLLNDLALPAVRRIAPYPRLVAMQEIRSHLAVMHIRRGSGH